ncbi:ABC transporter substrate-binding protein [Olsenella profusa]|uniref:ABC transporter substrate-binding protein n=1 Tax=Olsenella profusa TaxID=138595 RepID=A0ABS2F4Z5_9ACTN|nr:ABC transporter substrate-binding protein [Olsenella profusa]MBM6775623.1 ABC transporter substrate-binding protein [Olsenella profusa]
MRRRTFVSLIASAALAVTLAACGGAPAGSGQDAAGQQAATRTVSDSLGRQVELPAEVERIAASGPVAQQVLLTVAPERMVGLSSELTDEQLAYLGDDLADLPVFGQIYGGKGDFNREAVAAAAPQVIIDVGEPKEGIAEELDTLQEQVGIPCVHIDSTTLESYSALYDKLAEILDSDKARELADYCRSAYAEVTDVMAEVPDSERPRAAYLLGEDGTNAMARGGFQSGIIDLCSENVVVVDDPSSSGKGNEIGLEQIALWNPDLIVFVGDSIYDTVGDDPAWAGVSAIASGNYFRAPSEPYNWISMPASVNQIIGLQWYARLCYPDRFDDDLRDVVGEYYELFYGHELTDAEYEQVMRGALRTDA